MVKTINTDNIDINQKLNIRMLLPYQTDGRPVAPLNYNNWVLNSKGFNDVVIDFTKYSDKNKIIAFDEYNSFVYINNNSPSMDSSFLRYDIDNDIIQLKKHQSIITKSDYDGYDEEDDEEDDLEDEYRPHLPNIINPSIKDFLYFCENSNIEINLRQVPEYRR